MISIASLVTFFAAAAAVAQPAAGKEERIFRTEGYVGGFGKEGGRYLLQLHDWAVRYRLPRLDEKRLAPYGDVIVTAYDVGVRLGVQFDGAAGRLTPDGDQIEYPLCTIEVDGASVGSVAANCPPRQAAAGAGERALALGLAHRFARPDLAIEHLGTAVGAKDLPPAARAIALEARGTSFVDSALSLPRSDPDHDAKLMAAYADFQRLAELQPDNEEAHRGMAGALTDLGAYDEALAIYADLLSRGMDTFRSSISAGAVHRLRGDYMAALRTLDELAEREGPMEGMRYHYHRGWTLRLLGRHEEAIAAVSKGMTTQPDYPFALLHRACSYAQLGRHREARADQEQGLRLLRSLAARQTNPVIDRHVAEGERALERLRRAVAAGETGPLDEPCQDGDEQVTARERSALLPPLERAGIDR